VNLAVTLTIDGRTVTAEEGATILDAAESVGIPIPTLCRLKGHEPGSSCFLCVVEIQGRGQLLPSCAARAADGLVVLTDSERVRDARRAALELLLSDHTGDCVAPCSVACPAGLDIPGFIRLLRSGRDDDAMRLILEAIPLPRVLGRICPRFCERVCRRGDLDEPVSICLLKRFAADESALVIPSRAEPTCRRVAIVGAGPSGLSAAFKLLLYGHSCVIYDANPEPGGLLRYAIPEYRLPVEALRSDVGILESLGAEFRMGARIGTDVSLEELEQGYDAVLLALGAGENEDIGVEGCAVAISGMDFLRRVRNGEKSQIAGSIAILGNGDEAIAAARTALRLGATNVNMISERKREHMRCRAEELREAEREGIKLYDGVSSLRADKAASGYVVRFNEGGGEEKVEADAVIAAGQRRNDPQGLAAIGLEPDADGKLVDHKTLASGRRGVFSAGEMVSGPGAAARAVAMGKRAADSIDSYLRDGHPAAEHRPFHVFMGKLDDCERERLFRNADRMPRANPQRTGAGAKGLGFAEIERGFSRREAMDEAARCIQCDCGARDDCGLRRLAGEYDAKQGRYPGLKRSFERDESHPTVVYESGKCILCGICVRICEQAGRRPGMAFLGRGFVARAAPPFGASVAEALGDLAGECASACPTGALSMKKDAGTNGTG